MHQLRLHLKQFISVGCILLLLSVGGILGNQVGFEAVMNYLRGNIVLGLMIYTVYAAISAVIVTLPIMPVWPFALAVFGFWGAVTSSLIGILIGCSISFWLARKYGKKLVIGIMGERIFAEMQHLVQVDNPKTFFLIRLFGNNYFDAISYIAGLSRLSYKKYIVITAITSSVWLLLILTIVERLGGIKNVQSFLVMMALYGAIILIGTVVWEVFHRHHRKHFKKRN